MTIRIEDIGCAVRDAAHAVRGPVVARAAELERAGRSSTATSATPSTGG